ncbi:MAG: 2-C-methyl-D-erythritol 4-phosphate cytidylyltransferase [Candidatus Fischerbacteria bacterium RBG_13_37_8]|uniref:2-C-methyl-D-erythritol 4-phosphate cytidylyltransferase n=1 Tax=Candidatus Fischerbacteria bacterium RBG_13_37_8 TaxID=1817863 RepID=A0A1F5VUC2_9BACT|nr:MAG: 2-C-methyl-D-erythritol 4-phosphate cytidylyltransferase [Candidatus Fischerbacteria bacterium RBG_13_37_8]
MKNARKIYVVIAAAGEGARLGGSKYKALVPVKKRAMLWWSLKVFSEVERIGKIVVVIPKNAKAGLFEKIIKPFKAKNNIDLVEGEAIRQLSVMNGIKALKCENEDIILVHDAARPLITVDLIERILEAMRCEDCAVPVVPLVDTVKEIRGEYVTGTLNRDLLRCVQTPQAFRYQCYKQAIAKYSLKEELYTDESVLFEKMGYKVKYVDGERLNIKITYKEDLLIAESILCE